MPKVRENSRSFLGRIVKEFPTDFKTDGGILYCKWCERDIPVKQIFQAKQHLGTVKHMEAKTRKSKPIQTLLPSFQQESASSPGPKLNEFNMDICKMFLQADIPLHKLTYPGVKNFIQKYTPYSCPDQSTLRKHYVPVLYKETLTRMQLAAKNKYLWISLDETTDVEQRSVVNFIFGIMGEKSEQKKSYLLTLGVLDEVNNSTIATFFNDAMHLLYPEGRFFT